MLQRLGRAQDGGQDPGHVPVGLAQTGQLLWLWAAYGEAGRGAGGRDPPGYDLTPSVTLAEPFHSPGPCVE